MSYNETLTFVPATIVENNHHLTRNVHSPTDCKSFTSSTSSSTTSSSSSCSNSSSSSSLSSSTSSSSSANNRKASFIENLSPTGQQSMSRKNSQSCVPKTLKEETLYRAKTVQVNKVQFVDPYGRQRAAEVVHKRYCNNCHATLVTTTTAASDGTEPVVEQFNANSEGILSIAILKRHILCDCLILVKQYRPSLKAYALEFPAKIVDHTKHQNVPPSSSNVSSPSDSESSDHEHNNDQWQKHTRELAMKDVEDNTGYRSVVVKYVSPETAVDPELCDTKLKLVSLIIDGDDPIKNNFFRQCSISNSTEETPDQQQKPQQNTEQQTEQHVCTDECMQDDDVEVIPVPINGLLDRLNEYSRNNVIIDSRVYAFAIGLKKGEGLVKSTIKAENIEIAI